VRVDVVIVGGGIVGLATAWRLLEARPRRLVVLEAEPQLAAHQTGRNSGVIHAGLYYRPGSLKARLCAEGREDLFRFCEQHGVPVERCGKLVVATRLSEVPRLDALLERGLANGLRGLTKLPADAIVEVEPHARGVAAVRVPDTGIVDFRQVCAALAAAVERHGGEVWRSTSALGAVVDRRELRVSTTRGDLACRLLVGCAGLHADRFARSCGLEPEVAIVPFRGEYYELVAERRELVRHLIYPVPDPAFPFLGVHFTRRIDGAREAGPNAVLALAREGYRWTTVSLRDLRDLAGFPGFWRLGRRYWRAGLAEAARSLSKRRFVRALQRLVPELRPADLRGGSSGVRAQAVGRDGQLLDDFHIVERERMIHVLNAPSPAATAALAIGGHLAELAASRLGRGSGAHRIGGLGS
jgi:(S)-2-hydroxyglutarate dehydrogenase